MKSGIDFICIGAQKAGTSWLHWNLLYHPQTAMPPTKEINFFHGKYHFKEFIANWTNPFFWRDHYVLWRKERTYGSSCSLVAWYAQRFNWYRKYLYFSRTPANYSKLFARRAGTVTGDISPAYADLSEPEIATLAELLPNTKIIYLLRNPIDRAWSQYKMDNSARLNHADVDILSDMKYRGGFYEHSCYEEKIARWERYFSGRFRVWFYDELCSQPEKLFTEICEFLTIKPTLNFANNKISKKVFEGKLKTMPSNARSYLSELLLPELQSLQQRFKNVYTEKWLLDAENNRQSTF